MNYIEAGPAGRLLALFKGSMTICFDWPFEI